MADRAFESFATDGPRTWRKLNAAMCLATQSVSDVLAAAISGTLIEQTPTKIFFPNPEAAHAEYVEGLGLSEREFRLIKEQLTWAPGSSWCGREITAWFASWISRASMGNWL
ncbi:MAG: hypothetical protein WDM77_00135 [Steroidobacteraceae bacterium]